MREILAEQFIDRSMSRNSWTNITERINGFGPIPAQNL